MENEFYVVMKALTDDELLKRYLNKSDYTQEAISAMELVLKERHLEAKSVILETNKQKYRALSIEEINKQFQISEFGRVVSDSDYAQERRENSIYLERYISPLHNLGWAFTLFIILGGIGLAFALIIIGIGEYMVPFNYILFISVVLALLLPLGIWKTRKNKSQITVVNERRHDYLIIKGAKDSYKIQFPLKMESYWKWEYIKLNLKQVKIVLYIFDDQNNTVFELSELQVLTKAPPPHIKELPSDMSFKLKSKNHLSYTNYGTQIPFLIQFHKIVSGLGTKKAS